MSKVTGYRIVPYSIGYSIRELSPDWSDGWPVEWRFTLWGARRVVRRLLRRHGFVEDYPIGG